MNDQAAPKSERWGSKLGVILAVAGSAVGLGNFLRFPGLAAKYGGGAFMVPYFLAFLLVGIPICWAEWTMGRYGGRYGFHSCPGIFSALIRHRLGKYIGALGLLIPIVIYMYYVYIESWCLAYAYYYVTGQVDLGNNPAAYARFFEQVTGSGTNGVLLGGGIQPIVWFFIITFIANFYFVYHGLSKGIERFCKIAMPLLILAAIIVVTRVLTLPPQPMSLTWQQSLSMVLSPEQWDALKGKATDPKSTPAEVQAAVTTAINNYFDTLGSSNNSDSKETVTPPAGFYGTDLGMAMAMADLRAGTTGEEFSNWISTNRDQLPTAVKVRLQQLEAEQMTLQTDRGKLLAKQTSLQADVKEADKTKQTGGWLSHLFGSDPADELAASQKKLASNEAQILAIETERASIFKENVKGEMPSLTAQLTAISLDPPITDALAGPIQQRYAALGMSELPRTVWNALGYMWNPDFHTLLNPDVWIAAAGQIFFSLSVGFGIILTYASYLRRDDDVVLSGLTASATNEFCEVILGGLVAIPATFLFLGTAMTLDVISNASVFGLGFNTLPAVFANMPAGRVFGAIWFFLLFLAGITSSLSMLQPAIAFFEEGFGLKRRASVASLGLLTMCGSLGVLFFSKNLIALDTMDFWVGSIGIFILATIEIIVFGWVIGIPRGFEEAHRGAQMRIPRFFGILLKYVTPAYLLVIFGSWLNQQLPSYLKSIVANDVALLTVIYLVIMFGFLMLMVHLAGERWREQGMGEKEVEA